LPVGRDAKLLEGFEGYWFDRRTYGGVGKVLDPSIQVLSEKFHNQVTAGPPLTHSSPATDDPLQLIEGMIALLNLLYDFRSG